MDTSALLKMARSKFSIRSLQKLLFLSYQILQFL